MSLGLSSFLVEPWWTWDAGRAGLGDVVYRWFNLAEAVAWFAFGVAVLQRWARHRNSPLEIAYAAAFILFGLTDVREAWQQSAMLFALKGVILAALLALRSVLRRRYYADSRLI